MLPHSGGHKVRPYKEDGGAEEGGRHAYNACPTGHCGKEDRMRKDVLKVLERAEWMRRQVERVDACLQELTQEEALVLECLTEAEDGRIMAVCMALDVSERTAYRRIDQLLGRISELFEGNGVTIP